MTGVKPTTDKFPHICRNTPTPTFSVVIKYKSNVKRKVYLNVFTIFSSPHPQPSLPLSQFASCRDAPLFVIESGRL